MDSIARLGNLFWLELNLGDNQTAAILIALACYALPPSRRIAGLLLACAASAVASGASTHAMAAILGVPHLQSAAAAMLLAVAAALPVRPLPQGRTGLGPLVRAVVLSVLGVVAVRLQNNLARAALTDADVGFFAADLAVTTVYAAYGAIFLALTRLTTTPIFVWIGIASLGALAGTAVLEDPAVRDWVTRHGISASFAEPVLAAAGAALVLGFHAGRTSRRADPPIPAQPSPAEKVAVGSAAIPAAHWLTVAKKTSLLMGGFMTLRISTGVEVADQALFAAATLVLIVAAATYLIGLPIVQKRRNRALAALYQHGRLAVPTATTLLLYLRSFDVGASGLLRRVFAHMFGTLQAWVHYFVGGGFDLEEELAAAVSGSGLLLAIGDKRISYGAAKLTTGDTWQDDFRVLANRADLIVFAPGLSPGAMWEMAQVLDTPALRDKTVWVMPSGLGRRRWEAIAHACAARFATALPAYRKEGGVFRLPQHDGTNVAALGTFVASLRETQRLSERARAPAEATHPVPAA